MNKPLRRGIYISEIWAIKCCEHQKAIHEELIMDEIEVTADKIIDVYYDAKPRYLWKLDRNTYDQIKTMKNANGRYLWSPDLEYEEKPGYLLGIEIGIVDNPSLKIVLIHSENVELMCKEG